MFTPGTNTVRGIHYRGACTAATDNGAVKISWVRPRVAAAVTTVDNDKEWSELPLLEDSPPTGPPTCQGGPNEGSPCISDIECDGGVCSDPDEEDLPESAIPTVSEWGMVVMALLIFTVATIVIVRRRRPAAA